jgi:SAM-dependent methyltransferase
MAKRYGSPILELAHGTGRITLTLAKEGYEIEGIELSADMSEIAGEKLEQLPEDVQSRVTLHKGDITDFDLDKKFVLIIIPTSFKFLLTTDDQLACLRCVRNHLQDDGVFILDLYPGEAFEEDGAFTTASVEVEGATVTKSYRHSNDLNTQLRRWDVTVEVKKPDGEVKRIETQSITSLIFPREIDLLVKHAGFHVFEDYGNWDFSPYKPDTYRRIMVLKSRID